MQSADVRVLLTATRHPGTFLCPAELCGGQDLDEDVGDVVLTSRLGALYLSNFIFVYFFGKFV